MRADRRLAHRRKEDQHDDLETVRQKIIEREKVNKERWSRYYGFDYTDPKHYEIRIDTSNISIEEVVDAIIRHLKTEHLKKEPDSSSTTASN